MLKLQHALLASLCLLPLTATETIAATAGVTAAVNQNAKSIPPGGAVRTVVLGANVVQDETIETDGGGLVQILLADGTTFTVGPNSSITIDRFVYDPTANTAQVSATIGRGVFRFIGGRTSKTEGGVQLNTPVGTVGIRGGMADLNFTGAGQIDLLFGNEVTLDGPNGSDRIFQPGYSIVFGSNGQPTVIKTPPGSANFIQQALAGRPGSSGGSSQKPTDGKVAGSGVPGSNSDGSLPNPQNIPQPDLRAIELATPKPNDSHQVAEQLHPNELPAPGKRGFAAGFYYVDDPDSTIFGLPVHDFKGDTRVLFDNEGVPLGGRIVVGLQEAEGFEDETYELKVISRVKSETGDYPGAPSIAMTLDGTLIGGVAGIQTSIEESDNLLVNCECVQWGTWEATFGSVTIDDTTISGGMRGAWITGDVMTASQYAERRLQDPYGTLSYSGKAAGFGQYIVGTTVGDIFSATGDVFVQWNLGSETGLFSLHEFGGQSSVFDEIDYSFTGEVSISRNEMEAGLFSGATDPDLALGDHYMSAAGAFANSGSNAGDAIIGSFNGLDVFEDNGNSVLYTGSGVFAGDVTTQSPPPWFDNNN